MTLQRHELFVGDLLKAGPPDVKSDTRQPWISAQPVMGQDAIRAEPASQLLIFFTTGNEKPERAWLSLESLLRDRMPPLEDLIIGGHPGPIGTSSGIAIIIGGLFLLYRGLIDYRIPLLIVASALICLLILPIPVVITENANEWRWIAMRETGIGWPLAVTFANYEIMASPLLFMAFFLATAAAVRPMTRRARTIFALLVGALSAICQLYASVSFGPYLALLLVSLLTPTFDKWFHPRTLVLRAGIPLGALQRTGYSIRTVGNNRCAEAHPTRRELPHSNRTLYSRVARPRNSTLNRIWSAASFARSPCCFQRSSCDVPDFVGETPSSSVNPAIALPSALCNSARTEAPGSSSPLALMSNRFPRNDATTTGCVTNSPLS
jgi:hypothetical protein